MRKGRFSSLISSLLILQSVFYVICEPVQGRFVAVLTEGAFNGHTVDKHMIDGRLLPVFDNHGISCIRLSLCFIIVTIAPVLAIPSRLKSSVAHICTITTPSLIHNANKILKLICITDGKRFRVN